MLSITTGIYPENWQEFEKFCKQNDVTLTYKSNLGNYFHVSFSIDADSVDSFEILHERWIREHKTWWQKLFNKIFGNDQSK